MHFVDEAVIEGALAKATLLNDSTLRIYVDIDPRNAKRAFSLLGEVGQAMAIVGLKPEHQQQEKPEPTAQPKKEREQTLGPLCWWAVQRCNEPEFMEFLEKTFDVLPLGITIDQTVAANVIRKVCNVSSRKELDTNKEAARKFKARFIDPYNKWLKSTEVNR